MTIIAGIFPVIYCQVLPEYTFSHLEGVVQDRPGRDDLICSYFQEGLSYNEIILTLLQVHGILLCLRQLKRILARLGLKRKFQLESPMETIVSAILKEVAHSGQCIGYRAMWQRLVYSHRLNVKRDMVLDIMRIVDPNGIERRKRRRLLRRKYCAPGPKFIWHVDGYDKLKPFGFTIHAAIDGYSRRVLWIEVRFAKISAILCGLLFKFSHTPEIRPQNNQNHSLCSFIL